MSDLTLTKQTYTALQTAYNHFNLTLFADMLPACIITLQRKAKTNGYYCGGRFASKSDNATTDEIALNPAEFARDEKLILSTLVHEMVHLWQYHFGRRPRRAYHDKQWAAKMDEIGLTPTSDGTPNGKRTGQKMTHMIVANGPFDLTCTALLEKGKIIEWTDALEATAEKKAKAKNRHKYICPACESNVWAKGGLHLTCTDCQCSYIDLDATDDDDVSSTDLDDND